MKKIFSTASLFISGMGIIIMYFTYYNEIDNKELTIRKDYQDIYLSDLEDYVKFYDSLGDNEYLTLMPSKIKIQIPSVESKNVSISEFTIKNTGSSIINNDKNSSPIEIQLPKESKIYLAWIEDSYLDEKPREIELDTLTNTAYIREFLLNSGDELWITIVSEFSSAKFNHLNPYFTYKNEGITGFKDGDSWDPLNLNKYIEVHSSLYGLQIVIFFIISLLLFIVGSFRVIVFNFSNKRKLIELIFVFIISICLGEISTYLIFNREISLELSSIITIISIFYYVRLYLFIENN